MKRYLAHFELVLDSPLHIGSGRRSHVTDSPVHRDAFGLYRIPGTSLAGVLRAALRDSQHGELEDALFGKIGALHDEGMGSRLAVSDGYLIDFDGEVALNKALAGKPVTFRLEPMVQDFVRLDAASGTAATGGKFDQELIPHGTRFWCEMEYTPQHNADNVDAVQALSARLQEGAIQLGGGVTRGYGLVRAENIQWTAFDLAQHSHLRAWVERPQTLGADVKGGEPLPLAKETQDGGAHRDSEGISGVINVVFEVDGSLRVGGNQAALKTEAADLTFAEFPYADYKNKTLRYEPTVAGSGIKGAIRTRAQHILESLGCADVAQHMDRLFGHVNAGGDDGGVGKKGKVAVWGGGLGKRPYTIVQHVAIDRLTGGALRGALFSEAPLWEDNLQLPVELRVRNLTTAEAALLMHVLMDMGEGRLAIGAGGQRGNGRLLWADGEGAGGKEVTFALHWNGQTYTDQWPRRQLEELVDDFDAALKTLVKEGETAHANG